MATTLDAKTVQTATLPIIDVSGLSSHHAGDRAAVGKTLRASCLDKGFFYCSGHGVPQGVMDAAFEEARGFFDQTLEEKMRVEKSVSKCNRGYEVLGGQTLEAGAPPDRKEGYYIGLELDESDPRVVAGRFNRGPNVWPEGRVGFRPAMKAYFAALQDLGERLMQGMALSLNLPEDHFKPFCKDPMATLRLLHYPPQRPDAGEGEKGAGAHTDFGGLTILMQDDVGGLQVFDNENQSWIHANPVPGAFVVNLGDMIARWTNDTYRSTLHRVVNASGRERYSIPFFYVGNPDYVVSCIETCVAPGGLPKYPPITVEEHLQFMYKKTYVA